MSIFDREPFASFLGRGNASITVPVLDGAFRPNDMLEKAKLLVEAPDADAIAVAGDRLVLSAGSQLLAIDGTALETIAVFDQPISAMTTDGRTIALTLNNGELHLIDSAGQRRSIDCKTATGGFVCPTALLLDGQELVVAEGSRQNGPGAWSRDLLERNSSGRLVSVDIGSGASKVLATRAAFPNGVIRDARGELVFSQSWRHCLSRVGKLDARSAALGGLPGFPSRLSKASDGGYWLALFGMRTQLLEFVLREDTYRRRMLATVPPEYWIAPALQSRENFLDPLQQGGVKQLGIKKPWAPPRSYGLVVKLGADFEPEFSLHSRVDGVRHGITSVCEWKNVLYVVSKGAGQVVAVDLASVQEGLVQ